MTLRPRRTRGRNGRADGQSLVEFAIIAPLFLLVIGAALDMGRLFYAHVAIENAAKEGALYGGTNPRCDVVKEGCPDGNTVRGHVLKEAGPLGVVQTITCLRGSSEISVEDCEAGDAYRVRVDHTFTLVTPILAPIIGDQLQLESVATAGVLNAAFDPSATPVTIATPTPLPTVVLPTALPSVPGLSPDPSVPGISPLPTVPGVSPTAPPAPTAAPPTASPTAAPSASPPTSTYSCRVPLFIGTRRNDAADTWTAAGFTGTITVVPDGHDNGNYLIVRQDVAAGSIVPCSSSITVGPA